MANIGTITGQLQLDGGSFASTISKSVSSLDGLTQSAETTRESIDKLGKSANSLDNLANKLDSASESISKLETSSNNIGKSSEGIDKTKTSLDNLGKTAPKLTALDTGAKNVKTSIEGIGKSASGFEDLQKRMDASRQRLDQLGNSANKTSLTWSSLPGKLSKVGGAMTASITVPLTIFAAKSIAAARSFETAFTGVRKTVNGTEEDFQTLKKGILALSTEIPATANEIAKVAEIGGQLGIAKESLLDFSKTMINMGETTNLSSTKAAESIAKIANIFETPQNKLSNFASTIVALGNNLATNESNIANMATRMATFGKQAGLSEREVLAFSAALSSVGVQAEAGGTAFGKVIITMNDSVLSGGKKLEEFARVAGVSAEEFAAKYKAAPAQAISAFVEGLGNITKAGGSVTETLGTLGLSNERTKVALGALAGNVGNLNKALSLGDQAWRDNTALTKEAELRYKTTDSIMAKLDNTIFTVKEAFGEALLPVLNAVALALIPMIKGIGSAIEWFQKLPGPIKSFAIIFGTTFALGGPLLLALAGFIAAVTTIGAPLLIGGAIIAGLVAGLVWVISNWEELKAKAIQVWEDMKTGITENVRANIQNIQESWAGLKGKVIGIVNAMFSGITSAFDKLTAIADKVKNFTGNVLGYFTNMWDEATKHSIIPDMIDDIEFQFTRLDQVMVGPVQQATEKVLKSFNDMRKAQAGASFAMPQGGGGMGGGMNITPEVNLAPATQEIESGISTWTQLMQSFKFTTRDAFQNLAMSLTQVFSTIRTNFVNSIVGMIAGTNTFKDFLNTMWQTMLAAFLNLVIQMGVKWAITQAAMTESSTASLIAHTAVEEAKTVVTTQAEAARAIVSASANKVVLGGAIATLSGLGAVGAAAMATMEAIVTATAGVLTAIGLALAATIVGAPFAPPYFAAATAVETAGTFAVGAGSAAITGAISGAVGTISGLMATPFAEGGMVTSPTLALIGEAGPEVVAPFSDVERMMQGKSQDQEVTVIVNLDGRTISRSVMKYLPGIVRMQGIPI